MFRIMRIGPRSRVTIRTFDDFVAEAGMLPDGTPVDFAVTDPLEQYFFGVADKHGIIDEILLDDYEEY